MKTENAKIKKINVPYIKKLLPRRLFNSASAYVQSLGLHFEERYQPKIKAGRIITMTLLCLKRNILKS